MKFTIYIVSTFAALWLAIQTGNFFAWWLLISVFLSPILISLLNVASNADDVMEYN